MKKFAQIFLSLLLIVLFSTSTFSMQSVAYEYEGDKYLPDFVLDIANGSDATLGEINDFDRYERLIEEAQVILGSDYKVEFESGGPDHTHQYICSNALRVLANDKGNCLFFDNSNASLLIEGADWPDKNDRGTLFDTHFYNPYTETNYHAGPTTAKVKAKNYYDNAVSYYRQGNLTEALNNLGRGSHFVQDACEAHHATNKIAGLSNHSAYETYIDSVRNRIQVPNNTLDESVYQEARYCSVGQLVRNNAYASYCLGSKVTGKESNPDYFDAARSTVLNGIVATAQYFYKFAVEVGLYQ